MSAVDVNRSFLIFFHPNRFQTYLCPALVGERNIINTWHHNIIINRNSLSATRPIITPRRKYFLVHVKVHLSRTIEISYVIIIIIYYTFVSQSFQISTILSTIIHINYALIHLYEILCTCLFLFSVGRSLVTQLLLFLSYWIIIVIIIYSV